MRKLLMSGIVLVILFVQAPALAPTSTLPVNQIPNIGPMADVPVGFTIDVVSTGFGLPSALAFGNGGGFGLDLYVGDWVDGAVYRLDVATGTRTVLASGLPNPGTVAFGLGGGFTTDLYVATSDGAITILDPAGGKTLFTALPTPMGRAMAFDPSGSFGGDLYVMDTAGAMPPIGDKILRVKPDGTVSLFTMTPRIPPENEWGMAFGSGVFGTDLFVTFGRSPAQAGGRPSIFRVDPAGDGTPFAEVAQFEELSGIAISTGGAFGEFIYAADVAHDVIYRVDPLGQVSTFATGMQFENLVSSDMAFGPDGNLYVAEDGTHSILRIRPAQVVTAGTAKCTPKTMNLRSLGLWITCRVEPEAGHVAADIVKVTVRLDSWLAPVLDSQHGFCGNTKGLLKFDRQRLSSQLTVGEHTFLIEGSFTDGSKFSIQSEPIRVTS